VRDLDLPEQDADVLIDFIRREDGTWFLRVRDRGIGMTADTLQNYFLRAGASFRRSAEWAKEFLDEQGMPRVARAGRFGIGAFAVFLLGSSFRLSTRHAAAQESVGYTMEASAGSQLIEIRRAEGLPVGTTVEVELTADAVKTLDFESKEEFLFSAPERRVDWFCWDWPKVVKRVIRGAEPETLDQQDALSIRELPPTWSAIHPESFDAVCWTFEKAPRVACNGMKVAAPNELEAHLAVLGDGDSFEGPFHWPAEIGLKRPNIAVLDSEANLDLTVQRYALANPVLPFHAELARDVALSFIAHALVCGPTSLAGVLSSDHGHPLRPEQRVDYPWHGRRQAQQPLSAGRLGWCATSTNMVPAEPWLYSLLETQYCVAYGSLVFGSGNRPALGTDLIGRDPATDCAILCWYGGMSGGRDAHTPQQILESLLRNGAAVLGQPIEACRLIVSVEDKSRFSDTVWTGNCSDPYD
jgi:hypothetical protein